MLLPGIDIEFENGNLDQVVATPDGVSALIASATAVVDKFALSTPYQLKGMKDVADLGILPDVNNYALYKTLREFYAESGEGAELWLMGFANTTKVSDWFTLDPATGKAPAQKILDAANGDINWIATKFSPSAAYVPVIENGIDKDVMVAALLAQDFCEEYTKVEYAPLFVLIEAYAFTGNKVELSNLLTFSYNRVGFILGDTEKRSGPTATQGAAIGLISGRLAKYRVQENIGKVANGPLAALELFIVDTPVKLYDVAALNAKGFLSFRAHKRKSGYYFIDDHLVCGIDDDYHYIARRRVIDKAYRLGYEALLLFVLDDINVLNDGTVDPLYAATIENEVETLIFQQMTSNGELSYNRNDANDRGCIFRLDLRHNITSTSKVKIKTFKVRSKAYGRNFDVPLGFVPVNSNNN